MLPKSEVCAHVFFMYTLTPLSVCKYDLFNILKLMSVHPPLQPLRSQ